MEKLLKQAEAIEKQQGRSTKFSIDSYADIVQAIHIVQDEMGITGTTAREADSTIQGSLAATKAAWENVITAIAGGNIDLQDSIDALVTSGINTINNVWPVISNALSGIADLVKAVAPIIAENLPEMVEEVLPKLLDAAITLLGGVAQALPGLFQVVLDAIGTLFANVKDYIDEHNPELGKKIDNIIEFFVNAWTAVKNYWDNTLKPAFEALRAFVVDTVAPAIQTAWQNVKTKIDTVFTAIKGYWDSTLRPAFEALRAFVVDTVAPAVQTAWQNIKTKIDAAITAIVGYWNNTLKPAFESLRSFIVDTVAPAVQTAWQNVKTKVDTVFTAIKNVWNNTLKPTFEAIRMFVVDTVAPAVQTAWQNVKTKVETVFTAIKGYWDRTLKPAFEALRSFVVDKVVPAIQTAWQNAKTKIDTVFAAIRNVWENTLKPTFEAIRKFLVDTLKPIFKSTFEAIKTTVDTSLKAIDDLWNKTVKPVYDGIVKFFSGVFTGDWEKAWDGIKEIVQGVWNAIQTAAETIWENAKTWGSTIIANFTLAFTDAWNLAKDSLVGLWDAITDKAAELWEGAKSWGKDIVDNFKSGIETAWTTAIESIKGYFNQIPEAIGDIVSSALNWGQDLIENFKRGIEEKWQGLKDKVEGVANSIKDFLGFSKPKKGPLSDFDTYAPDMMGLFIKGINDNMHQITTMMATLVSNIKSSFKLAGEGAYHSFNDALNGYWGDRLINVIKNPLEDAANAIMGINWYGIGNRIYDGITSRINDIRRAFDFSGMYVKTPHFYVKAWNYVSGTSYPSFGVSWYRKAYDNPIMFTSPTVLGTASGLKGFGDGPGGEIVLSDEKLRKIVGNAGGDTYNNTINVYQRDGEDMDNFVRRIEEIMTRHDNQRKAAFA